MTTRTAGIAVWAVLIFTSLAGAASPSTRSIDLGEPLGSVEVVRCHFPEGRIVVRFDGVFYVLHQEDQIEAAGLKVVEINNESATIVIRGSKLDGSLRIVRVTNPSPREVVLREFSTNPDSLLPGDIGVESAIATRRIEAPPDS